MSRTRPRRRAAAPSRTRAPRTPGPRHRRGNKKLRVLVLSGPNLDRLGKREPEIYGSTTLEQVHETVEEVAKGLEVEVVCRQTNHEGVLIDWINAAVDEGFHGLLINPGALTHTSYALMDSLKGAGLPAIEVHVTNPDAREAFRRRSRVAPACAGRVAGFGSGSYTLALRGLVALLQRAMA